MVVIKSLELSGKVGKFLSGPVVAKRSTSGSMRSDLVAELGRDPIPHVSHWGGSARCGILARLTRRTGGGGAREMAKIGGDSVHGTCTFEGQAHNHNIFVS